MINQPELFAEDLLSIVTETPRLLNDIIASMRGTMFSQYRLVSGRRWRNLRTEEVEQVLRSYGAYFGSRKHGAGCAVYVATTPFKHVADRWGKDVPVYTY